MRLSIMLPRPLKAGAGLLLLAGLARADMFNYNSSCTLNLNWSPAPLINPGTGAGPPVSFSGTGAGTNVGCSIAGSTAGDIFTASASAVTASTSGSTLTVSNANSENIGFDISPGQPISFFTDASGNYNLFGSAEAGVQGSFSGTFELTGPGVLSGAIGIIVPPSTSPAFSTNVTISQNGTGVFCATPGCVPGLPGTASLSGIDFSQPFDLTVDFMASINSGCCAMDTGGSLDSKVGFQSLDANGDELPVSLIDVPEPGTLSLSWVGMGLFALWLHRFLPRLSRRWSRFERSAAATKGLLRCARIEAGVRNG